MRFGLVVANSCVLAGISWMVAFGPNLRAAELLPERPGLGDVPALESRAARTPTASNITALAAAYLDRDQPGLASAVIEKAPREVREQPVVAHIEARALFRRGRVREALAAAETAEAACAREAPGSDGACPTWLLAKTTRQIAFLRQVVEAGIEDPLADPAGTRDAYERSTREVRIVAMR
jgi:hypothetical protein